MSKTDSLPRRKEYVIIVEGSDDASVVSELWKQEGLADFVPEIMPSNGVDRVSSLFATQVAKATIIGVVLDADDCLEKRLKDFVGMVEKNGLVFAETPYLTPGGLVVSVRNPDPKKSTKKTIKVGLWLMPNNQDMGALENFLCKMLPKDRLHDSVNETLEHIEQEGIAKYNPQLMHNKAFMSTWLAWQENPRMLYGHAIARTALLDKSGADCRNFAKWLAELFMSES